MSKQDINQNSGRQYNITTSDDENLNSTASSEQVQRIKIKNSHFELIGNNKKGYFISIGKYRLTEVYQLIDPTEEEGEIILEQAKWEIIPYLITIFAEIAVQQSLELNKKENSGMF